MKLEVEVVDEVGVQLIVQLGGFGWVGGRVKRKFKFKLKQELSLEKITVEIVATAALPVDHLMATDCNAAACAYFLTMGVTYQTN